MERLAMASGGMLRLPKGCLSLQGSMVFPRERLERREGEKWRERKMEGRPP